LVSSLIFFGLPNAWPGQLYVRDAQHLPAWVRFGPATHTVDHSSAEC